MLKTIGLPVLLSVLATISYANKITWQLEDYNGWNLPFAKTVEIQGRTDNLGDYPHVLALKNYIMRVDPSAIFSILFLEKDFFTDYTED